MKTRMPSTAALVAFDAAARHCNLTRAANELNLTQTAVSHQIKNLEVQLGLKLFERTPTGLMLTSRGEVFLQSVRGVLLDMSRAVEKLAVTGSENEVVVACLELFAIKRLIPLMPSFRARYPEVPVKLEVIQTFTVGMSQEFHVGIWHGDGDWPWVEATRLEDEQLFPVCSPALMRQRPLRNIEELAAHTIIRNASGILLDEWSYWLEGVGAEDMQFKSELKCQNLITSLQATLDGLGVMLGRSTVSTTDIMAGRLTEPLDRRVPSPTSYFLVTPSAMPETPNVQLFTTWLLEQMHNETSAIPAVCS
jgi:LysR family transcriptional regulator, glycine cleavage system transcriptional activator